MKIHSLVLRSMQPTYFIQKATIRGVKPTYNNEVFGVLWDVDLSILLEIVKRNGQSYSYTLNIKCCYQKDQGGSIIGWGSAFKLSKLFIVTGVEGTFNEDGTIPEDLLERLIGKSIYVLSYITGLREDESLKYQMWDIVEKDRQSVISEFESAQLKGYPKNYAPEARTLVKEQNDVDTAIAPANDSDDSEEFIF